MSMMSSKQAISTKGSGKYGIIKSSMRKGMTMLNDCSEKDAILYFNYTIILYTSCLGEEGVRGSCRGRGKRDLY